MQWAPALAQSACHQTDGQFLGTNLNSSESTRRLWRDRDCKKRQLFTEGGPVKVIEIIRTPPNRSEIGLSPLAAAAQPDSEQFRSSPRTSRLLWRMIVQRPKWVTSAICGGGCQHGGAKQKG